MERINLQAVTANTLPSDEERGMLRDSVRKALAQPWPAETAVQLAGDPQRVSANGQPSPSKAWPLWVSSPKKAACAKV
ncbi:MAG: hypothetical protein JWP96_1903 [Polaromonas sp.]|nr:hypothetical protein [Polaromonas sp.]